MNDPKILHTVSRQRAAPGTRKVFVRDLLLACSVGVHGHEKGTRQRVRVNLDLMVSEGDGLIDDKLANVVCYEEITDRIRTLAQGEHVNLVETLAERIAELCLVDPRVRMARVRVEKLDAFADVTSVGVEIERYSLNDR